MTDTRLGFRSPKTVLALAGLVAVLVACSSGASGTARDTDTTQPHEPAEARIRDGAPRVTILDEKPTEVGPPPGSPLAGIARDCGMSTPLSDGSSLWLFCDTGWRDESGILRWFVTGSAAFVPNSADNGVDRLPVHEPVDADRRPFPLLAVTGEFPRCDPGTDQRLLWATSAITVPEEPDLDRVLLWFEAICVRDMIPHPAGIGLAELEVSLPASADAPLQATILVESLFPRTEPRTDFGHAAVRDGDTLYLFACEALTDECSLARVPIDGVTVRDRYEFWTGEAWSSDLAERSVMEVPDPQRTIEPSVAWIEGLDRYVRVGMGINDISVRTASDPRGPWSTPGTVDAPGCRYFYPKSCFALEIHPELSEDDRVVVSLYDPNVDAHEASPTRLVHLEVTVGPPD
jgi:hypothetical protein